MRGSFLIHRKYRGRFGVIYLERLVSLTKITYTYSERFHEKHETLKNQVKRNENEKISIK